MSQQVGNDRHYRPDIDGLRAVAVISVLLFHAGFSWFPGGFVGVDVFFVISGFLITGIVRRAAASPDFALRPYLADFYIRRTRRLLPALFVTVAVTFAIAAFLFAPEHLERLAGAAIHTVVPLSNVYFWTETGYWDASKLTKPLLHTWSLAV